MTDHKYTDEEVIRALECHKDWNGMCGRCPYELGKACGVKLATNALDLINRQRAEIERLQKYNADVAFKHYNDGVKEFAERLETALLVSGIYPVIVKNTIHRLVKEMTKGDQNGTVGSTQ